MRIALGSSSVTALQKVITGDNLERSDESVTPYQTGGQITSFFGSIPGLDVGHIHLGTRWVYVEEVLAYINDTEFLAKAIEAAVHPTRYLNTEFRVEHTVDYLNDYLVYDDLKLVRTGKTYALCAGASGVSVTSSPPSIDEVSHAYILEQIEKGEKRIADEDFEGAITTARSLVETVLKALDERLPGDEIKAKGDLPKLYKGVARKLNLDPEQYDAESLKQILRGLTGTVGGIASLRNKMGDAHPRAFKPKRHHARLALNAAKTVSDFLAETYQFQAQQELGVQQQ